MASVTHRSLLDLARTASSSRVLNLNRYTDNSEDSFESFEKPFFHSSTLNKAIIIRHRLRAEELRYFGGDGRSVTKVVIPLAATDLKLGGQSFFVDQVGFGELIAGFYQSDDSQLERDARLLRLLGGLPSFDPFLLKEQTSRGGFDIDVSYFEISEADQAAINEFVITEISPLVRLSFGSDTISAQALSRLTHKILDACYDEEIAPIRDAFRLSADAYRESAFSWKGFIYYKHKMISEMDKVVNVARSIAKVKPGRSEDAFLKHNIEAHRDAIVKGLHAAASEVFLALRYYDQAFQCFIQRSDVQSFKAFLNIAPALFVGVGNRLGAISHVQSYWRYRYPEGKTAAADANELNDMLQEFAACLEFEPLDLSQLKAMAA